MSRRSTYGRITQLLIQFTATLIYIRSVPRFFPTSLRYEKTKAATPAAEAPAKEITKTYFRDFRYDRSAGMLKVLYVFSLKLKEVIRSLSRLGPGTFREIRNGNDIEALVRCWPEALPVSASITARAERYCMIVRCGGHSFS